MKDIIIIYTQDCIFAVHAKDLVKLKEGDKITGVQLADHIPGDE